MTSLETVDRIHQLAGVGKAPGLARMQTLLAHLDHPERQLKYVHITGTNGKGSTASMVAGMLQAAGYRTGLFTSPHLYRIQERMLVDGKEMDEDALGDVAQRVLSIAGEMDDRPTGFEMMTAMGLLWFQHQGCDLVVLEVGLGGRLDPTNVIPAPEVAVLTRMGLEHTQVLGDSLPLIATEKAGIVKPGCLAVLYHQEAETTEAVQAICRARAVPLSRTMPTALTVHRAGLEGQTFSYRGRGPYHINLLGPHQLQNAMTALETVSALRRRGWQVAQAAVVRGLAETHWPGRLELVRRTPDFIVDGAHNPQCLDALMDALEGLYPGKQVLFLAGVLADKDYPAMLRRAAGLAKAFVTVTPDSPRALDAGTLAQIIRSQYGLPVTERATVAQGVDTALSMAGKEDVICAWGSLYSVGEIRHHLGLYECNKKGW